MLKYKIKCRGISGIDGLNILSTRYTEHIKHQIYCLFKGYRIKSISYSEIFRRIRKIKPVLNNNINNKLGCIIDSTGYKITIRGNYLRHKWYKMRKGCVKLHVKI